jgi:hypothetical protein
MVPGQPLMSEIDDDDGASCGHHTLTLHYYMPTADHSMRLSTCPCQALTCHCRKEHYIISSGDFFFKFKNDFWFSTCCIGVGCNS